MNPVSLRHCESAENAEQVVRDILNDLGEERVYALLRGKAVLLKPNLCIDYPPERGATTHPAVVEAMVRICLDAGARVTIGDGAAVGVRGSTGELTGMLDICPPVRRPVSRLQPRGGCARPSCRTRTRFLKRRLQRAFLRRRRL